jgi:hypothetical protein
MGTDEYRPGPRSSGCGRVARRSIDTKIFLGMLRRTFDLPSQVACVESGVLGFIAVLWPPRLSGVAPLGQGLHIPCLRKPSGNR